MTHEPETPTNDTLDQYLADELDPRAAAAVAAYLDAVPARRRVVEAMRAWPQMQAGAPPFASADALAAFDARVAHDGVSWGVGGRVRTTHGTTPRGAGSSSRSRVVWGMGVTAIALLLAGGATFVASRRTHATHEQMAVAAEHQTKSGERASVALRDGSRMVLGPATTARVLTDDDQRGVTIALDGEALFTVRHATARPVTIVAHDVTTRVLGTEFAVRAYDAERVSVAVRSGKVSVQAPSRPATTGHPVTVTAGRMATIGRDGMPVVTAISSADRAFGWAAGQLVMEGIPLGDALVELSRWYGLEFRVSDRSLLTMRVDAVFTTQFDMGQMQDLADILGADVSRSGSIVTLSRRVSRPSSLRNR